MSNLSSEQIEVQHSDSDQIDLGPYWQIVTSYFWRILGLALFLTMLVTLIVLTITPQYKATASLLIEAEQANVLSIEEIYGIDSSRKEYFETQFEILRSRQIAGKLVEELSLFEHPLYNLDLVEDNRGAIANLIANTKSFIRSVLPFLPQKEIIAQTEQEYLDARKAYATELVIENLSISPIRNTQVVEISFVSADADLAAQIANTLADVYIDSYLQSKLDMTAKATAWLNESLQGLRGKLDNAEDNLSAFYEQEQLVNIDGVVGLASDKLQQLSNQLIDAQIIMKRNAAIYERVNKPEVDFTTLAGLPEVLNHPSIQNIKREEVLADSRVSELREVYGPKHPTMIAANAELTSIRQSLNNQIKGLISGITTEYEAANAKVKALSADVAVAKSEFRKLSNLENRARSLQREVNINQQLYDSFFTRLKETDEIGGFESANARVLDPANTPIYPSKPAKALIVVISFVFSIVLGVFLAIILEALNSGIRSVDDVEQKLGQRLLGIIPWQQHSKKDNLALRHFFDSTHHLFGEAVRTFRTSLQLLNLDKPSQTILITSSVPSEGKSTVSINLAFAMAQLGKVLLVDTDLRRPTLAKQFNLPGFQPGLANLIAGTHTLEECLVLDEESGLSIICAGPLPPNPQELLASEQFTVLMKAFRSKFDHVILDSPPTQAVSDAVIVSKHCDSVVYVVKADSTDSKLIRLGLGRFLQIGHRVDGIVLNQVDLKKASKNSGYSGFYDQYGYNSYTYESKQT